MDISSWIMVVLMTVTLGGFGALGAYWAWDMARPQWWRDGRCDLTGAVPGLFLAFLCWGILAAMLFSLPGCNGRREPKSGVVVKKGHRDSYTYMVPVVVGKVTHMQPRVMPERWWLAVEEDDGEELEVSVGSDLWGRTEIGDRWHVKEVE